MRGVGSDVTHLNHAQPGTSPPTLCQSLMSQSRADSAGVGAGLTPTIASVYGLGTPNEATYSGRGWGWGTPLGWRGGLGLTENRTCLGYFHHQPIIFRLQEY